ncbi:PREDICTED: uncharacterized protein LOC104732090 [Camelina sativa]|uniref:Uncharacterized protein LOC104732090 n=1 Tax=Camelina sativa TaxID=90675 RepID=A0ABM0V2Q9_CAMSA|nr:PREDICTED: uncharacterized protein LOC104732090 [Camelina sativa]
MGCGKSKHDVVTGNYTKKIRKLPSEVESVKGKESETIERQESCRCGKKNDISNVVWSDQPEITVENNTKKPEEKNDVGDYDEKTAVEMKNGDKKPEEKETTDTSSPMKAVATIVPENIVTEETVNDVNETVPPVVVEEQKENSDIETVAEEEKSVEDNIDGDGDVDTEVPSTEVEEPKPDVEAPPVTTELEVLEIPTTENEETAAAENDETVETEHEEISAAENDQTAAAENDENVETVNDDETPVLKDEDKVDVEEENPADIAKEVESV